MRAFVLRWGRLLRLSLAATAVADLLAGASLAGLTLERPAQVAALIAASLCVYHGGMALNDWADREVDARLRADRPIPAGAISSGAALAVALLLLSSGVAFAALVSGAAALAAGVLALTAAGYDLFGRGPWLGPFLLGACRAGNLALPLLSFDLDGLPSWAAAPLLYGAYVFAVSRLGRLEDAEEALDDGRTPRRRLAWAATLLALVPLVPLESATLVGRGVALALTLPAGWTLWRAAREVDAWSQGEVERCMGLSLRRLLLVSAGLAALPGSAPALASSAVILMGFPLAHALRRVFPPS